MISVIIPVLNGADTLPAQLGALAEQTYRGEWEVIVADNGSIDETDEVVRSWTNRLPSLRFVSARERPGPAHARNAGAREARGTFLAFCDADDVVSPGWLQAMEEAGRVFDLVGGQLERQALNDRSGADRGHRDRLSTALRFLPAAAGANLGIRKDLLEKLGGWDDEASLYGTEDKDLSFRAQLAGYRLGFAQDALVHYRHRRTARDLFRQFYRWGSGQPLLYRRYRDAGLRRESLSIVVRAWLWFLVHLPDLARRDTREVWLRKAGTRFGRVRGSIRYRVLFL